MRKTETLSTISLHKVYEKLVQTAELLSSLGADPEQVIMSNGVSSFNLDDNQIAICIALYHKKISVKQDLGQIIEGKVYTPWLEQEQVNIKPYYWNRYKKRLIDEKGFPPAVISSLDMSTFKILDHLENPKKSGQWTRRGMVVGHVQSGKTANFTGLICKAADAGYQVIIVLAGMLNSLRDQTQTRLDYDFIGHCADLEKPVGVGVIKIDKSPLRRPIALTTKSQDFKRNSKKATSFTVSSTKEPIVFVLKKNKSTLINLYKWLKTNNDDAKALRSCSMLMIDDEADHASINTNSEDKDPTAINNAIRDLLALFGRSSYVGYTATPFANVFIDPESEHEMFNGEKYRDLFPRDFIFNLNPPSNYFGPNKIFSLLEESDDQTNENLSHPFLKLINDHQKVLPLKHKSSYLPPELPPSLKIAIQQFILAKAIRIHRGHTTVHHSMMVNVSRFNLVQDHIKNFIHAYVEQLKSSISNYGMLSFTESMENQDLENLYQLWKEEYSANSNWEEIQTLLSQAAAPIMVLLVNSKSPDQLDYSKDKYPSGRTVIAIGGLSLSRGLTLEGLCISYFLRNSIMYDTLMQMGRWFGYRDQYEDLCRIYMTAEAASWYSYIHDSTEELRQEFIKMQQQGLTPKEFGLKVRSHPTSLIVTARNKMRSGNTVPLNISLANSLVQTWAIRSDQESLKKNEQAFENLIYKLIKKHGNGEEGELYKRGPAWLNVSNELVKDMLLNFRNYVTSFATDSTLISDYLDLYGNTCDILLRSKSKLDKDDKIKNIASLSIIPIRNEKAHYSEQKIVFPNSNISSHADEAVGLNQNQIDSLKLYSGNNYRTQCRRARVRPLLSIYFIRINPNTPDENIVPCFTVSFPILNGENQSSKIPYVVNMTLWKEYLGDDYNEDDED